MMATLDSFDLPDINDPSVIALTPQPHSVDATLFNGAHHRGPSGGIDRSLFSLSCSLYFPSSNKRHRHRHTSLAKIALRPRPIDSPTVSKNPCAPPTLCWSDLSRERFFALWLSYREPDLIGYTVASAGGNTISSPGREGEAQGPWGEGE